MLCCVRVRWLGWGGELCCDVLCGIEVGWAVTLHCVEWSRGAAAARVVLCGLEVKLS